MTGTVAPRIGQASARRIVAATLLALAAAAGVLVAFVLPAEYGVDPLGTGRATGLLALAEPGRGALAPASSALAPASSAYVEDAVSFRLQPFESVEYKYRLEAGDGISFAWRAGGALVAELHAEPDDAPEGFAESFDKRRADAAAGSYLAPFAGWHGWFWENRSTDALTVSLNAAGFFSAARTYSGGRVDERAFAGPVDDGARVEN